MKDTINIAIVSNGGLTNFLINLNFVYYFCNKYKTTDCRIILFGSDDLQINEFLLTRLPCVDLCFPREAFKYADDYDVCIYLRFYPEVLHESKVAKKHRELHRQLDSWRKFRESPSTRKFYDIYPEYDFNIYIYSILNGRMCLNIRDIDGSLGLGTDYDIDLSPDEDEAFSMLRKLGLKPGEYITVHTGKPPYSSVVAPTRLWNAEYYETLIGQLHQAIPRMKAVQIGTNGNRLLKNIDLDLVGKQSFTEFASVLRYAAVHIGSDSGAVHLRKAMKGRPSVVLFGPTPSKFYGYEGNVNIQKAACPHWCAGLTDTWRNRCLAGDTPTCMDAITPDEVRKAIEDILKR